LTACSKEDYTPSSVISEIEIASQEQCISPEYTVTPEETVSSVVNTTSIDTIPDYSGTDVIVLNGNVPSFTDFSNESYECYSELDPLGRCGEAFACIGTDLMPTEERGEIGSVKPTGWVQAKYDPAITGSDSPYLYNRCHLIGYQLTGENANERNLITGTRQLNVEMMLPYENMVTDYVRSTGNHVLYRVTPIFEGDNLLAKGVQMEGFSIEDGGSGICFNIFCYNVERGVTINYATGESSGPEYTGEETGENTVSEVVTVPEEDVTFVLNTNSMKFHLPDCDSVQQMSENNRQDVNWSREECINNGYTPCGGCRP